jgi:hypothetical protein
MAPKSNKSTSAHSKVADIIDTATATISKASQVSNQGMLMRSKAHTLSQSEAEGFGVTPSPANAKLK